MDAKLTKSFYPLESVMKSIDSILDGVGEYYITTILLLHVVYIAIFLGLISINTMHMYINMLNIGVQLFIGLFLTWRFHPLRTHEYKKHDAKIIFGSGIFLLTNLGFFSVFQNIIQNRFVM
jgi:hypothetical protein